MILDIDCTDWISKIRLMNRILSGTVKAIRYSKSKGIHVKESIRIDEPLEDPIRIWYRNLRKINITFDRVGKNYAGPWLEIENSTLDILFVLDFNSYQTEGILE